MSEVVPGSGPGKKTLVPGPRQKFVFDWGPVGMGPGSKFFLTETGPEPKIFLTEIETGTQTEFLLSRTANNTFLLEMIIFTVT
jgi:hypothetical protein